MLNAFLAECLTASLVAAKRAGKAILEVYQGHIDVTYKDDKTPLTLADEKAHSIILNYLSSKTSKPMPVLSEEGKHIPYDERQGWKHFWLVDPLDGTKEFIRRRGEFTVNIALINRSKPVLGVVFVPAKGFLYFAAEGLGSYKLDSQEMVSEYLSEKRGVSNGSVIEHIFDTAKRLPLDEAGNRSGTKLTIVGSRSHASNALTNFVQTAKQEFGDVEFVPAGSALKFGLVAEGSAHVYPRLGPTMEWDTAAGQCVVEQSGGAVLHLKKRMPLDYNKKDLRNPAFLCTGKHDKHLDRLFQPI